MDPRRPHNLAESLVAVGLDPFDGKRYFLFDVPLYV